MTEDKQSELKKLYPACLVISFALLIRIIYWLVYLDSPIAGYYRTDHKFYHDWGLRISQGEWFGTEVFVQGPLYAYLLGCWFWLFAQQDAVLLLTQSLIGCLTCLLLYFSTRQLFGDAEALIAGLFCAMFGPLVFYDVMMMKSYLSPFLTTATLYCGVCYQKQKHWGWLIVAGVCIGLALLIRENHILMAIPVVIIVFQSIPSWKLRLGHLSCLACGCLMIASPVIVRNTIIAREPVLITTGGGEVFYMAHGPDANGYYAPPWFVRPDPAYEHEDFRAEARRRSGNADLTAAQCSRYWYQEATKHILADPIRTLKLTFTKLLILLNDFEVPDSENYKLTKEFTWPLKYLPSFGWFTGLGVLGLVIALSDCKILSLPIGLLLAHIISVILIYNFARFRLGMMPLWLMFSAVGICWLYRAWFIEEKYRFSKIAALIAVMLISFCSMMPLNAISNAAAFDYAENSLRQLMLARQRTLVRVRQDRLEINRQPEDTVTQLRLAIGLMQLQQFAEACEVLETTVKLQPKHAETHKLLGTACGQLKRWDQAIEHLETAHKLEPENTDTLNNLGTAYEEASRHLTTDASTEFQQLAVAQWKKILQLNEKHLMARYNLAKHWIRTQRYSEAIENLHALVEIAPSFEQAVPLLEHLVQNGHQSLSRMHYQQAAESLEQLAVTFANTGRVTEALHAARLAIKAAELSGNRQLLGRIKSKFRYNSQ